VNDSPIALVQALDRPALPVPTLARWQPLRLGVVELFHYDSEEFWFRDGHLLLRGNNGTGKSKVLALTLPFLLDGELAPNRVEPDGDRNKRMEWNLLLGGKHPNDERTGYTWLEFGRIAEDGVPEYRTVGCGLKAVKGRGIAKHWFFVTPERIGPRFALMSATRVPLTRERLRETLDGHGHVYDTATCTTRPRNTGVRWTRTCSGWARNAMRRWSACSSSCASRSCRSSRTRSCSPVR